MPRKSIGVTAMTDAERQARYRAAGVPVVRTRRPADHRGRAPPGPCPPLRPDHRLVADHSPTPDRARIIDRQFRFDDPDAIEPVAVHRDIEGQAELPSSVRGQRLIKQAQM